MTAREQVIELMKNAAMTGGYTEMFDALLSDEGAALMQQVYDEKGRPSMRALYATDEALVEYLKQRGVLVRYNEILHDLWQLRLPGETTDDLDDARYYAETGRLPGGES